MEQENVEICSIPINGDIDKINASYSYYFDDSDLSSIEFKNKNGGSIIISDYHDQDCCEHVYADWGQITPHIDSILNNGSYTNLIIKGVPQMGILLVFEKPILPIKILIPCYNSQNGYYSSNLLIIIKQDENVERYDVSDYVKDIID